MIRMPPGDWKHWAKDSTQWIYENTEDAFWRFVNHRWRDSLNVAAAEPAFADYNQDTKKGAVESMKKTRQEKPRKPQEFKVTMTSGEAIEKMPKKCCLGRGAGVHRHPPP
jgi:hypothetical protein